MDRVLLADADSLDLETLMAVAERIARERRDGHLTLLRFTTGWKCMLGTPALDGDGRAEVSALPAFPSAKQALADLICRG